MTAQKPAPRRNPSMPAERMRAQAPSTVADAATQVVEVYSQMFAEHPIATELFIAAPLREAIEALRAELAK